MDFDASSFVFRPSKVNMMSAKNVRGAWFCEARSVTEDTIHWNSQLTVGQKNSPGTTMTFLTPVDPTESSPSIRLYLQKFGLKWNINGKEFIKKDNFHFLNV